MDEYIPTKTEGVYIVFDGTSAKVINKKDIETELAFHQAQLLGLPKPVTDKQLLDWAKLNYPTSETEKSRVLIETKISELQTTLGVLK